MDVTKDRKKMKIGDMVELSAYGSKRRYNAYIEKRNKFGLVIEVPDVSWGWWRVRWYPSNTTNVHSRNEIKYAQMKKKA
jgi:hypothetical protein